VAIVLLRDGDSVDAIDATCTHAGGPLAQGTLHDHIVTCPWHGSQFCLRDGRVRDGPATVPARQYEVRIRDGQVEARLIHI
jgi:nitrite reductase/ring-hydroxylating ferredoxin subunit